jgi:hypothetical protein
MPLPSPIRAACPTNLTYIYKFIKGLKPTTVTDSKHQTKRSKILCSDVCFYILCYLT